MPLCRALTVQDYTAARALYEVLSTGASLPDEAEGAAAFETLLSHPGTSVFAALRGEQLVSMATLHILPNMTYGGQPYGLIENVVTARSHQRKGVGRQVLTRLIDMAWQADAYKVMLLTGQARGAQGFYRKVGFDDTDKHGMVVRRP